MLNFRTLDNGLPLLEVAGPFEGPALDELAKALSVLDAEPVIIVSLDDPYLDGDSLGAALNVAREHDGNIVFVVPKSVKARRLNVIPARETLHVVDDFRRAAALGAAIQQLSAVQFSRDGVATPD